MTSNSNKAKIHSSLFISPGDDVKMRFVRALLAPWPGKSRSAAALIVAQWLIENMDWATGKVQSHTSARYLMDLTTLSRTGVDDGLKALVDARLIERPYLGKGRRGGINVHKRIAELRTGECVLDLWPTQEVACNAGQLGINSGLESGPVDTSSSGLHRRPVSGLDSRPEWPALKATYPIPSSPEGVPAAAGTRPEVEGALPNEPFPTPHHSSPNGDFDKCLGARARVAGATSNVRVADGTESGLGHYGYGTPIAGLNGHTSEVVDQLVAVAGGIILDKTPYWVAVHEAVRQTSPERVQAAILDLGAAKGAGKLKLPPTRALAGFARNITEEQAKQRIADATKPRVSGLTMFGLRR